MLTWGRLKAAVKRTISYHVMVVEYCHDCGKQQPVLWQASDELWNKVMGSPAGVTCPYCFDRRAKAMGIWLRWWPMEESIKLPAHPHAENRCLTGDCYDLSTVSPSKS